MLQDERVEPIARRIQHALEAARRAEAPAIAATERAVLTAPWTPSSTVLSARVRSLDQ
jgi:hypothetical protein